MANVKKNAAAANVAPEATPNVTPEATTQAAPQVKKVKIRLPKLRGENEDVFVSVNNYSCVIKRGVEVEVPEFVKEVLDHQEEMLETIQAFEEKAGR